MNGSEIVVYVGQYAVGLGTLALTNTVLAKVIIAAVFYGFLISLPLGPIATLLLVAMEKQPELKS